MKYRHKTVETTCLTEGCYFLKNLCALVEVQIIRKENNNHILKLTFTHPEILRYRALYIREEYITLYDLPVLFREIEKILNFSNKQKVREELIKKGWMYE